MEQNENEKVIEETTETVETSASKPSESVTEETAATESAPAAAVRRKRKRPYAAPIGAAYLLLLLIGIVAVILAGIRVGKSVFSNEKEIEKLELKLYPVLMYDPVPFETVSDADPVFLLQSSITSVMYSDKRESYPIDNNGMMTIPVTDINVEAVALFGPDVVLTHRNFDSFEMTFRYDYSNQCYRVPASSIYGYYIPQIESMKKVDKGVYELRVGYVANTGSYSFDAMGKRFSPTPDKYMTYVVVKNKKDYYISAIRDAETAENPTETH